MWIWRSRGAEIELEGNGKRRIKRRDDEVRASAFSFSPSQWASRSVGKHVSACVFVCVCVCVLIRVWSGGAWCGGSGGGEFPCWAKRWATAQLLIRPVSAAFPHPGFPHLSSYLSVCQAAQAGPGQPSTHKLTTHTYTQGKCCCVFESGWESVLLLSESADTGRRQTWNQTRRSNGKSDSRNAQRWRGGLRRDERVR